MLNRTPKQDESLREYFFDKLCLLNRCDISGKKAVDCIVYGIVDRSIRNGAQALNCSEPEDLLSFLCSQKPQIYVNNNKFKDITIQKNNNPSTSSNPNVQNSYTDSIICYNCRSQGHPYYKCTKPILKCKRCRRVGHNNDGCKLEPISSITASNSVTTETNSEKKTLKIDIGEKGNAKYFKSVIVDGRHLEVFIDFGSECTLLIKSNAVCLNLLQSHDEIPVVRGFGQSSVIPLYKSHVCLRVDDVETTVEVLVVDDIYMQLPMIIGQNFTELPGVTVLKDSHSLIFYQSLGADLLSCDHTRLKLYLTDSVKISKVSVVTVYSSNNFTGDVFIEGYNAINPGKEYRCLPHFQCRQTTPEERHLHSYELETLAVVCSLQKFRVYLIGLHFKIFTDCAALRTTLTKRGLIPRIARWWLQMCEYTFDIEYRPGTQMSHVDALSRNTAISLESDDNTCVSVYSIEKQNWLLTLQLADPDISRIHNILKPEDDMECKDIRNNYIVKKSRSL
nr:uncharacterized protein LOC128670385 [Plodia interpunctella]